MLVVGAPHANEPIGCLAVLRLLDRLAHDRALRQEEGCTWHLIPAIDVDGVALNEGWFSGPRTLRHYFHHYFRPAFALQPEYSFPLRMPGYQFDAPTPENLCWQRALAFSRPALQCSLHGNDTGGVFYLLSEPRRALARALSTQPARYGLAVNRLGEPEATTQSYAPGVLSMFKVRPLIEQALADKAELAEVWNAGQSATEFAASLYGTTSMTSEMTLWEDARLRGTRSTRTTMADVIGETFAQAREDRDLLGRARPLLNASSGPSATVALDDALAEAAAGIDGQVRALERAQLTAEAIHGLAARDLVQYEAGTTGMRIPALVARRALLTSDVALATTAEGVLRRRIEAHLSRTSLRPVPYARSAALQALAVVTAARLLR